ncbi:MAG TPA: hypothetical protein VKE94_12530 [Gemmataceae bacterium]|nr:hypothetical protein [Gemmataceae bacterium]
MPEIGPTLVLGASGLFLLGLLSWLALRRRWSLSPELAAARFQQQREHLEADFLRAAAHSGKPRGLRWKHCDWQREVLFARDKKSGELTALVGVSIQFEAIEGSDMEGLPAVGNLRHASGVFFFRGGRWRTVGRAVFNLNPGEAIEHFKGQYERLELT